MEQAVLPVFIFAAAATGLSVVLLVVSSLVGPKKNSRVKEMPYESGMDPIHDTHRRFDVRFEDTLSEQLASRPGMSVAAVRSEVVEDQTTPTRLDGNNVEIDMEMMRLNKNTLLGNTYLQLLTTKLGMMRRAVSGRAG